VRVLLELRRARAQIVGDRVGDRYLVGGQPGDLAILSSGGVVVVGGGGGVGVGVSVGVGVGVGGGVGGGGVSGGGEADVGGDDVGVQLGRVAQLEVVAPRQSHRVSGCEDPNGLGRGLLVAQSHLQMLIRSKPTLVIASGGEGRALAGERGRVRGAVAAAVVDYACREVLAPLQLHGPLGGVDGGDARMEADGDPACLQPGARRLAYPCG